MDTAYPEWVYYPLASRPPPWVSDFVEVVSAARPQIDSERVPGLTSDRVLTHLREPLQRLGYQVEVSKLRKDRIRRPVLFGAQGRERVAYEIDAVHDALGIVVEIEAGRGARGNAVYRDLIRTALIVDVRFLVLGVMRCYRHQTSGKDTVVRSFQEAQGVLDAIYASGRLQLPFTGVLLLGY
jgi:hypothetical protein